MGQFSFWLLIPLVFGLIVLFAAWRVLARGFFKKQVGRFFSILMTDDYPESLLELYSAFTRAGGPIPVFELNLRSEQGKVIERPLGSPQAVPNLSKLRFDVAQVHILPTEGTTPVETSVVIGPKAEKPLYLSTPIMVGGMAYGIALSEKAKIALAKGSALAGTSITSGSGPFLQVERDNAKYWILQYSRAFWAKEDQVLSQANAIEIPLGQGSFAGLSHKTPAKDIDATLQKAFPIPPGQEAVILARHAGVNKPEDFKTLITSLRARAGGIPIGVKMACSKDLELDLEIIAEAGVDFINISGSQGATYGSPPSIGDSFGLPTLFALVRAGQFFEKNGLKGKISLITGGGFTEPGEMLKALALGADAVEIGSAALFAISHTEVLKAVPFEPPTQIVWYTGK
ncbi:MAG TPA: FMN-binding glutamate synthase family protein, partial [Verrucomicrobiae bacterium]|nr:FMN-binding glutamate synthase family protein [Verrucomicrobiae bacterium]